MRLTIATIISGILFFAWLGFVFWYACRRDRMVERVCAHLDERELILARYDKDLMLATDPEERARLFVRKEADLEQLNRP